MKTKQWQPPISAEDDGIFEQMAELFIDAYDVIMDSYHGKKVSGKTMLRLEKRYMKIIREYQKQLFAQTAQEETV